MPVLPVQVLQAEALAVGAHACLHNQRMVHKVVGDSERRTKAHGLTQPSSVHALMVRACCTCCRSVELC